MGSSPTMGNLKNIQVRKEILSLISGSGPVDDTQFCDQLIAWQTPFDQVSYNNQVDIPGAVYHKMDNVNSPQCSARKKGMMVSSTIELGTSPLYIAEFTREDAVALITNKMLFKRHHWSN
ncbi:hypothetical protein R6Q59_013585 [Mikania micrantha]